MKQKGWLITAVISLILLFFVKQNIIVTLITQFFVNNFAAGRSDFKVVAFLSYLFIVSLLLFLYGNWRTTSLVNISKKKILSLFLILLVIGFGLGFASYAIFVDKFDLEFFGGYKSIEEGRQSSTQLFHIHNSKAGLAKILDAFSKDSHNFYDAGLFYAKHMPKLFWMISIIISPMLFILGCILILQLYHNREGNPYKEMYTIFLIISSFAVIKNTIDGGLFDTETIFWLAIFLSTTREINNNNNNETPLEYIKTTGLYLFITYVFFAFPYMFFYDGPIYMLLQGLGHLMFFLLIFFLFVSVNYDFSRKNKWCKLCVYIVLTIIIFSCSVVILAKYYPSSYINYTTVEMKQLPQIIPDGSLVYIYYPNIGKEVRCDTLLYEQGDFKLCKFTTEKETTMFSLLNKYSLVQPNYTPIKVVNHTCVEEHGIRASDEFILIEGTIPQTNVIDLGFMNITFEPLNATYGKNEYKSYRYVASANRCIPTFSEVLQRVLNKNGIRTYIIIT